MKNLTRIDQNFATNALDWVNIYKEDFKLCFDIMFYISNKIQTEIFKYGHIDLDEFCKVMGYKKNKLQSLYSSVYKNEYGKPKKSSQQHIVGSFLENYNRNEKYITVFENALYKLGRLNVPFKSTIIDSNTNEKIKKTQFIQILKEINIHQTKDTKKIYYTYLTSPEFDYNLSKLFLIIDFTLIPELRTKNLTMLYLYLKLQENYGNLHWTETNFFNLCNLCQIKIDLFDIDSVTNNTLDDVTLKKLVAKEKRSIKDAKYTLQTRKFDILKKFYNFEYEPINVSGRWKYGFKFTFNNNIELEDKLKNLKAIDEKILLKQIQHQHIMIKIIKLYKSIYKDDTTGKNFETWFINPLANIENKRTQFFKALAEVTCRPINGLNKSQNDYFNKFFSSIDMAAISTLRSNFETVEPT
ncbi:MAG: hypothetical protein WC994_09890 [Brumimicrobium sp.]